MNRHGPAVRTVPHSGFPRWETLSRMGVNGSCEWVWAHRSPSTLVFPQPASSPLSRADHGQLLVVCPQATPEL